MAAQAGRLRAADARLADVPSPGSSGWPRLGRGRAGAYAGLGWTYRRLAPDDPARAWTPDVSAVADALVLPGADAGPAGTAATASLLEAWAGEVAAAEPGAVLEVTWPAADADGLAALTAAGLVAEGALAVRPPGPVLAGRPRTGTQPAVRPAVRLGVPADLDVVDALHREEMAFHAELGGDRVLAVEQDASRGRLAAGLRGEVASIVHVAELAGVVVAMCESQPRRVARTAIAHDWLARHLPPGAYGYLNTVCVTATARGTGVGRALVRGVLDGPDGIAAHAADGTYLWYDLRNPISPGFWRALGYRPLWLRLRRPAAG